MLLAMLAFARPALASNTIVFAPPNTITLAGATSGLATSDLDGDGKADIAVNNGGFVSVLYGNGNGTFSAPVNYASVQNLDEHRILEVDVNRDGRLDIIYLNGAAGTANVLINLGGRTFAAPRSYLTGGGNPVGVVSADFNGDGWPDLALPNYESNNFGVLLNNGDGTFTLNNTYAGGGNPAMVAVGDFNNDGAADIAMSSITSGDVNVYLGNGDGTFVFNQTYGIGDVLLQVLALDLNGDGKLDLATTDYNSGQVSVLMGNGDGTFAGAVSYPANSLPVVMESGDMDGDGFPDLVIPNAGTNYFTVLRNNGNGTFAPPISFTAGNNPRWASVADFDGDGKPDVVVSNASDGSISIFLNRTGQPLLDSLTVSPSAVTGSCQNPTGLVTLTAPAPSGGAVVSLLSDNPAATVPPTVTVPAGATSARFAVTTSGVTSTQTVKITATYVTTKTAQVQVQPIGPASVALIPNPVVGPKQVLGQVTLEGAAAPGTITVALSSSNPSIASVPASIKFSKGALSAQFSVKTSRVSTTTFVTITATANGKSASQVLIVQPK